MLHCALRFCYVYVQLAPACKHCTGTSPCNMSSSGISLRWLKIFSSSFHQLNLYRLDQYRPVGGGGGGVGSRDSNGPPLEVNNGGLTTQTVDFQLLANSGGMENKLKLPCKKTLIVP